MCATSSGIDTWPQAVGVAVPFVVALIIRTRWPSQVKALVALGVAVVFGGVAVAAAGGIGDVTWAAWAVHVGAAYGAAQALYALGRPLFKKIEETTNRAKPKRTRISPEDHI